MSPANVETVRRAYAAYDRGGFDALFAYLAVNIEWDMTKTTLDSHVYQGHDEVRRFFAGLAKLWDTFSFTYDEYIDAGDEVLAIGRLRARGKGSGVELETPVVHIWTLSDGVAVRLQAYLDRDQAMAAVGLRPR